ncbi:MAG: acyl-CoA dehydrogenase family protein [Chthoniobacterales bacterium]
MITPFFKKLSSFLEREVAPIAYQLDEEADLFRKFHERFVDLGSLNFLIPQSLGGLGGERREWIEYNVLMAQYSGALLFLQAQHQYSVSRLKKLLPDPRVEKTLRWLAVSKQGIGLALAKNKNLFHVASTDEGYHLSGTLPWVTGLDYFSHLLLSFEHNGMLFYTLLPFQALKRNEGNLLMSPKIETAVFNSISSNSMRLDHWFISHDEIIFSHPIVPKKPIEHPSVYNLAGAAKALLKEALQGKYGNLPEVKKTHGQLSNSWNEYYHRILEDKTCPLTLRAEGVELAERCVLLSRVACGSVSVLKSHPVARLSREIWQYTIAGYSEEQLKAYLMALV